MQIWQCIPCQASKLLSIVYMIDECSVYISLQVAQRASLSCLPPIGGSHGRPTKTIDLSCYITRSLIFSVTFKHWSLSWNIILNGVIFKGVFTWICWRRRGEGCPGSIVEGNIGGEYFFGTVSYGMSLSGCQGERDT